MGKRTGSIHAARLSNSERLQRVADLLSDGYEYSTLEICHRTGICAVSATVSELRKNGIQVAKARRVGDVWYYRRADVQPRLFRSE